MNGTLSSTPESFDPEVTLWPTALWPKIPPISKRILIRPRYMRTFTRWVDVEGHRSWYAVVGSPLVDFAGRKLAVPYRRLATLLDDTEMQQLDWLFFGCAAARADVGESQKDLCFWRLSDLRQEGFDRPAIYRDTDYSPQLLSSLLKDE